jgi:cytochrome c biogenesis protein CcmG/thiol:disulfide interchange protein DsbE
MMTLSQETTRQGPQDMAQDALPPPYPPPPAGEGRAGGNRRVLVLLPLALFLGLATLFITRFVGIVFDGSAPFVHLAFIIPDTSRIPSALIGHDAPATDLPPVAGLERDGKPIPGLAAGDFKGAVTVLNVWASWCVPCHDEAPLLVQLARDSRIRLVGINYKDQADNARRFLGRYGNPFVASGADVSGRAAIEWGVYGVPETFIIGRDGKIAYKLVGPVTPENIEHVVKPELEKALAGL